MIGTQAKGTHENSVTLGSYSSSAANNFDQTAKALSSLTIRRQVQQLITMVLLQLKRRSICR